MTECVDIGQPAKYRPQPSIACQVMVSEVFWCFLEDSNFHLAPGGLSLFRTSRKRMSGMRKLAEVRNERF